MKRIIIFTAFICATLPAKAYVDDSSFWNQLAADGISNQLFMDSLESQREADRAYYAAYPPVTYSNYNTPSFRAGAAIHRAFVHMFKAL